MLLCGYERYSVEAHYNLFQIKNRVCIQKMYKMHSVALLRNHCSKQNMLNNYVCVRVCVVDRELYYESSSLNLIAMDIKGDFYVDKNELKISPVVYNFVAR